MAPLGGPQVLQAPDDGPPDGHGPAHLRLDGLAPGRRSIVITRQPDWHHAGVETAHSLAEALALAGPSDEVFVVGGGEIYRMAMPYAARLLITEVDQSPAGSVTFPRSTPRSGSRPAASSTTASRG